MTASVVAQYGFLVCWQLVQFGDQLFRQSLFAAQDAQSILTLMVVVEELEHALARGAHIYAEIVGYGATSDGADMVAPSGEGAVRCMKMAMHGVDIPIDYLNTAMICPARIFPTVTILSPICAQTAAFSMVCI